MPWSPTGSCSSSTTCTGPRASPSICQVVALDAGKGRVGTVEDSVPAQGPTSVHREVRVRTSARAVTGVVDSCTRVGAAP